MVILHGEGNGVLDGCELIVVLGLSVDFPPFSCFCKFAISFLKYVFVVAFQTILRSDITDGAVEAFIVVTVDESGSDTSCVFDVQRRLGPDAFGLERLMKPFLFAVALRVIRRGRDVGHSG